MAHPGTFTRTDSGGRFARKPGLGLARGALLALAISLGPALVGAHAAAPVPGAPGLIRAPGGPFMSDSYGRNLQFHGFNLVAKCPSFSASVSPVGSLDGSPCIPAPDDPSRPGYWLSPDPAHLAIDPERTFTDADAARLAGLGFNIARLGIIWRALEPGPPGLTANDPAYCSAHSAGTPFVAHPELFDQRIVDTYLAHIDDTVRLLAAHGIYSLIDMHQDDWSEFFNNPNGSPPWEGEGAPLWATCTALAGGVPLPDTSASTATWHEAQFSNPALTPANDHFWVNDVSGNLQGEYLRTWSAVAAHYRGNPWIAGYDAFNEPYDGPYSLGAGFDRKLQCFYAGTSFAPLSCAQVPGGQAPAQGFIPTIQGVDPGHLIFFEPSVSNDFTLGPPSTIGVAPNESLPFGGLVYDFHVYGLVGSSGAAPPLTECQSPDCAYNEDLTMTAQQAVRGQTVTSQPGGPAMMLSEFGAEDNAADINHVATISDGSLTGTVPISWAYWAAMQLHDPTGGNTERLFTFDRKLVEPKGLVMARAYPRATAGTPTSQAFNPDTSVFDYSFVPDHAVTAPTEVVVPALRYGQGYRVTVSGATVTSACGANPVTLVADSAATTVSVHVERGPACAASVATSPTAAQAIPSPAPGLPPTMPDAPWGPMVAAVVGLGAVALSRGASRNVPMRGDHPPPREAH
ncbi:MAG: cellulase family glycosylhydrolase [Candidatus Dormibacteria bacterium]